MICTKRHVEAPRIDFGEGQYGCKYVDNEEASCEGNSGVEDEMRYHAIKCDSLYTYPDSSGDNIVTDPSRDGLFELPSVPFASTECDMKSNVCSKCVAGYRLVDGICLSCETGHECTNGVSQVSCNIGTFSGTTGSSTCTTCGVGRYAPEVQATECLSCSPGYEPNADRSGCDICPPTTSSPNGEACVMCTPGTYSLVSGKSSCDISEAGTRSGYDAFSNLASQKSGFMKESSSIASTSSSTPKPPEDELEEARKLAERFHSNDIVLDCGGWLMKETKSKSMFSMGRTVKDKRWFRLVYIKAQNCWTLRWYETNENEETTAPKNSVKLDSGCTLKIVNESRAVTVGRMPSAVELFTKWPSEKTYKLFTESTDPRAGATLLEKLNKIMRNGANNMDMPENEKVIEYLYAEALDRNNIKQAVAAKMRACMPSHQKWQYIVQSWVTEEAVTKGVMPWIAVVTQWPATIKRLLEDRDMVDTEMGKTIESFASSRNKKMLSSITKTTSSSEWVSTEWGPIVSKARELVHHFKSMAQGFRPWLHTFAELNGIAKLIKTAAIFAGREIKTLQKVEMAAVNELIKLMYELVSDQVGIGLFMDTPGSVEVLVYLLGKDHLYAEDISNKIVEMLTVMVFEAEDLIGVEELRRDQDESYSVDLKAAVPRRVTDAFRNMQDRCKENVAFEGFSSALRHAKHLQTSLNYLQLLVQILNATPSLQNRMILWSTFKRVDLIGGCYHVTKKWRSKLRGDESSKENDEYNTELDFMYTSKSTPLSNAERALYEGILTDFDLVFNDELLYMRNEDMQSQSSQFGSAGIEKLLQEFKGAVTSNTRKNVEMMLRSLTLTLTQTGDTPF
eukprot:g1608.t1